MRKKSTWNKKVLMITITVFAVAALVGCIVAALADSGHSGDPAEPGKTQGEVKDDAAPGEDAASGDAGSGSVPETTSYSSHMSRVFEGIRYPYSFVGVNDVQQTYVYDADDDGTPEVLAYSYIDTNEDLTDRSIACGFCTVDEGQVAAIELDRELGGMAITDNSNLYAGPDRTVYLWQSKTSDTLDIYDITINEYRLDAGKYTKKTLLQESVSYNECEARYDNVREYIPAEAEYISSYRGSDHTKATWCSNLTDAAGFLSMFDICVLPGGKFGGDWKKAYENYFDILKSDLNGGLTIKIASHDLNSDGVPEVFLITDSNSGTVNSRTAQCCTFANGRVISFPLKPKDEVELFGGGRDIRVDKKTGQLYYDGLTGGYGNDQLQFIAHIGDNGFVIDEAFKSGWNSASAMDIETSHNFETLDSDESMEYIFTQETFETKDPLEWHDVTGSDIPGFIQNLK